MSDQSKFFDSLTDYRLVARFYAGERDFTVEELYQAFKARLAEESATIQPVAKVVPIAECLALTFQYWLDRQELDAGKELDDDARLMQLPVNYQRGTIKAWIRALKGEK